MSQPASAVSKSLVMKVKVKPSAPAAPAAAKPAMFKPVPVVAKLKPAVVVAPAASAAAKPAKEKKPAKEVKEKKEKAPTVKQTIIAFLTENGENPSVKYRTLNKLIEDYYTKYSDFFESLQLDPKLFLNLQSKDAIEGFDPSLDNGETPGEEAEVPEEEEQKEEEEEEQKEEEEDDENSNPLSETYYSADGLRSVTITFH